jgi:hypothetical protein
LIERGPGPCEFRQRAVGGDATCRVWQGGAGRLAAESEVVEGGAQLKQRCALAA